MPNPPAARRGRMAKKKYRGPGNPPPEEKTVRIDLIAPESWLAEVDAMADTLSLSRSALIRMAVTKFIQGQRREGGQEK